MSQGTGLMLAGLALWGTIAGVVGMPMAYVAGWRRQNGRPVSEKLWACAWGVMTTKGTTPAGDGTLRMTAALASLIGMAMTVVCAAMASQAQAGWELPALSAAAVVLMGGFVALAGMIGRTYSDVPSLADAHVSGWM